jgi:release factor glutamine methyltransferase
VLIFETVCNGSIHQLKAWFLGDLGEQFTKRECDQLFKVTIESITGKALLKLNTGVETIGSDLEQKLIEVAHRLKAGEPIQYILGEEEFYGQVFKVNRHVLIPRPETEELVDLIIQRFGAEASLKVLDVGTGSGVIAISLALRMPGWQITGLDIDENALLVAKENAFRLDANVEWIKGDFLVESEQPSGFEWDLIVSNPPYISREESSVMSSSTLSYEPEIALFSSEEDPEIFYRRLFEYGNRCLKIGGYIIAEMNALRVKEIIRTVPENYRSEVIKDLSGKERILVARLLPQS